eukprot:gene11049-9644_t
MRSLSAVAVAVAVAGVTSAGVRFGPVATVGSHYTASPSTSREDPIALSFRMPPCTRGHKP